MRLYLTKIDEYQFLTCLKHSLWGSKRARFKDWQEGDYIAFIVGKALAGVAQVKGQPFKSDKKIWNQGVFPHRIPIDFLHVLTLENRVPMLGDVKNTLMNTWGPKYGLNILHQRVLTSPAADAIVQAIRSRTNNLSEMKRNVDQLLIDS